MARATGRPNPAAARLRPRPAANPARLRAALKGRKKKLRPLPGVREWGACKPEPRVRAALLGRRAQAITFGAGCAHKDTYAYLADIGRIAIGGTWAFVSNTAWRTRAMQQRPWTCTLRAVSQACLACWVLIRAGLPSGLPGQRLLRLLHQGVRLGCRQRAGPALHAVQRASCVCLLCLTRASACPRVYA